MKSTIKTLNDTTGVRINFDYRELQDRFKKWRQVSNFSLVEMPADHHPNMQTHKDLFHHITGHALNLPNTPEKLKTHGLFLTASPKLEATASTPIATSFRLGVVEVSPLSSLPRLIEDTGMDPTLNDVLADFTGRRSDELRAEGGIGWAIVVVVLIPNTNEKDISMFMIPMGFVRLRNIPVNPNWEQELRDYIEFGYEKEQ